ncbi:CAAX amino terminal protease self- immunity [Sphingobacterium mizutaii]|uniref:CAAX amino terminal protease self- immunity n=1 Tax=Sphingobacterium mizutaii TaxID=1010 RepID=A0AAJ5BZJ2_9SPHI|nr:CAAX protease self-immunity [Sphingobacterium mizutaii]SNV46058.1 CAAX amino terminal protease self- immunity [Sphingobacterium mizutaii]
MLCFTWLKKPQKNWGWNIVAIIVGLIPLPIFLKFNYLLADWTIWLPWILLALINPFLEEFYWRGLLMDSTKTWNRALAILFTSVVFSVNHGVFGINSELFRGYEVIFSTFIMGLVWAITYKKTDSLRWVIASHFLVDFLNLSAPAFLDLFKSKF